MKDEGRKRKAHRGHVGCEGTSWSLFDLGVRSTSRCLLDQAPLGASRRSSDSMKEGAPDESSVLILVVQHWIRNEAISVKHIVGEETNLGFRQSGCDALFGRTFNEIRNSQLRTLQPEILLRAGPIWLFDRYVA